MAEWTKTRSTGRFLCMDSRVHYNEKKETVDFIRKRLYDSARFFVFKSRELCLCVFTKGNVRIDT